MKLPGKSTSYKNSIIALFPKILTVLRSGDCSVKHLLQESEIRDVSEFTSALDCLYALGKIEITMEGLLHYAG